LATGDLFIYSCQQGYSGIRSWNIFLIILSTDVSGIVLIALICQTENLITQLMLTVVPIRSKMQIAPASWQGRKCRESKGSVEPSAGLLIEYVHLLQVERGKSAMWIASATQSTDHMATIVMSDVLEARNSTDACMRIYAKVWPRDNPLKNELAVLRLSVDHFRHPVLTAGLKADAHSFLNVLSGYTKLIEQLCTAIANRLPIGWHGAVLRSLIRYDEAMAHQRGLLCSLLSLPDRLFSVLPPTISSQVREIAHVQKQTGRDIDSMLLANKLEQRCQRLVSHAISLSCGLESLHAQLLSADVKLGSLRDTVTIEGCWSLFSQHLEDNRIALVTLAAYIVKSERVRLPLFLHHIRGNTSINVKMEESSKIGELKKSASGLVEAASRCERRRSVDVRRFSAPIRGRRFSSKPKR